MKKAAIDADADAARKRHQEAKKNAGVRCRPGVDGMGQVVIDCTATEAARILASVRGRAAARGAGVPGRPGGRPARRRLERGRPDADRRRPRAVGPPGGAGRLVDLRDVTSVFPGDATSARRTDRDHRIPHPLGPTAEWNLQNLTRRWHRAKQNGWHTRPLSDGTIEWTSPSRGVYRRKPQRTIRPGLPPGRTLPPLDDDVGP